MFYGRRAKLTKKVQCRTSPLLIISPNERFSHVLTYFKINIAIIVCVELHKDLVHKHGGLRYWQDRWVHVHHLRFVESSSWIILQEPSANFLRLNPGNPSKAYECHSEISSALNFVFSTRKSRSSCDSFTSFLLFFRNFLFFFLLLL